MLIIWLQGIWLPLHGYDFSDTPLWAGIFLLPLTAGFLVSGPTSGILSDRFGSRGIATAGMVVFGGSFIGLMLLPVNFPYWAFALLIAVNGIGSGMFAAPNSSSIMGSVPARHRGAASGMRSTFQNSGTALSIGVFFSLMIAGLAASLPKTLTGGLEQHGVPHAVAHQIGSLPPVSSLFAAVLGVNPVQHLLASGRVLSTLPAASQQILIGREFFPRAHLGAVPPGPGRGVRDGRRAGGGGGTRISAARRPPCPAGVGASAGRRPGVRPWHDNLILTAPPSRETGRPGRAIAIHRGNGTLRPGWPSGSSAEARYAATNGCHFLPERSGSKSQPLVGELPRV